jgi:thiol:disulfide interchange protein DsbD
MGTVGRLQQTPGGGLIIDCMNRRVSRVVLLVMIAVAMSGYRAQAAPASAPAPATAPTTATALTVTGAPTAAASRPVRPGNLPSTTELNLQALPQGGQAVLAVIVEVPPGYHAQSNTPSQELLVPFKVTMQENPAVEFSDPVYPPGHNKTYPLLGTLNVYDAGRVVTYVPVRVKPEAPPGPITLTGKLQYQICDDAVCLPPRRPAFTVATQIVPAGTNVEPNKPDLFAAYKPSAAPATQQAVGATTAPVAATASPTSQPAAVVAKSAAEWGMWTWFGAAVLAGLLFNVMPCVLPVLPLKAAAFHRAAEHHRGKSILLGLAFSMGIISVFGLLAVLVLVLRVISWGQLFAHAWFVWSLVALLFVCALGMFGVFSLELPTALYGVDPRKDTIGGNIIFGAVTAILATPCTAPLLPGLLLWASAQPAYIGVPAMLLVGVGMAIPYFILSATPELAKKFPRSGPWPELFKQMMGFMLLAVAVYFAGGRLIHGPEFWWLVVAVIAIASLYLVARTVQLSPNGRPVGVAATLAVIMLGGALWWTARMTGLLTPPVAIASGGNGAAATTSFAAYSDDEFKKLRAANKPVLVKFTANWCATCQYIEGTVFRDSKVWTAINQHEIVPLKVDLTTEGAPGEDLLKQLNPAGGIPLTAIYLPGRAEPIILASVYNSAELLAAMNTVNGTARAAAQ